MGAELSRENIVSGQWDDDLEKHSSCKFPYQWAHCPSGYQCEIKRNPTSWTYLGYVTLPENHPDYEKCYDMLEDIQVHGGLTYSQDGKFGFDCHHMGDLSPGDESMSQKYPEHCPASLSVNSLLEPGRQPHYWTFEEVKEEVEHMAEQFYQRQTN